MSFIFDLPKLFLKLITIKMKKIQDLKKGDYFRKKEGAKRLFIYNGYCRINRKYIGDDVEDISEWYLVKKDTLVFLDLF